MFFLILFNCDLGCKKILWKKDNKNLKDPKDPN
jgi:hypothetical protein